MKYFQWFISVIMIGRLPLPAFVIPFVVGASMLSVSNLNEAYFQSQGIRYIPGDWYLYLSLVVFAHGALPIVYLIIKSFINWFRW
jgi:hypothetical protein